MTYPGAPIAHTAVQRSYDSQPSSQPRCWRLDRSSANMRDGPVASEVIVASLAGYAAPRSSSSPPIRVALRFACCRAAAAG